MIRVSIEELLDFHVRKGTPDDYAPSVRLGDIKELVRCAADWKAEAARLRAALVEVNTIANAARPT